MAVLVMGFGFLYSLLEDRLRARCRTRHRDESKVRYSLLTGLGVRVGARCGHWWHVNVVHVAQWNAIIASLVPSRPGCFLSRGLDGEWLRARLSRCSVEPLSAGQARLTCLRWWSTLRQFVLLSERKE